MFKRGLALLLGVFAYAAHGKDDLKVLTIGNSFADSVFAYLPAIAEAGGKQLLLDRANLPGCSLQRHWELAEKSAEDPAVKPYSNVRSLADALEAEAWDVVTLQQASNFSWRPESYEPYLGNLIAFIKEHAPSAEIVIQQTWSYRFDEPRLAQWQITPDVMYSELDKAYGFYADKYGLRLIPTGCAVELARQNQPRKMRHFDPAIIPTLKYPSLPDQTGSMVNGLWYYKDADGNMKLAQDSFHLNARGRYLQACLWYGFLFREDPARVEFTPAELSEEDAEFLRKTASEALNGYGK